MRRWATAEAGRRPLCFWAPLFTRKPGREFAQRINQATIV